MPLSPLLFLQARAGVRGQTTNKLSVVSLDGDRRSATERPLSPCGRGLG